MIDRPILLLLVAAAYFGILYLISRYTAKNSTNEDFFLGNRDSNWVMVAIGMIGTSLSGVSFISIPGMVGKTGGLNMDFSYMQVVFGYLLGYLVIATVLLPIYYRYGLTSIYSFLEKRLGFYSYKTGAGFFLISRLMGASCRLFLVALVLQSFILGPLGVPFWANVLLTLSLIFVYSQKGGIKTIVVTDTVQTLAMISAVVLTIFFVGNEMGQSFGEVFQTVKNSEYAQIFFFENGWSDPNNFFKQFISGALIAIAMTGLDQDMMQKNLSCRNIGDAQKNVFMFSVILVFANLLFLGMGALLYIYSNQIGINIPARTDLLYPTIAFGHLPIAAGVTFFIGLIAAAYSSADSALTALTTSFCIDFLDFEQNEEANEEDKKSEAELLKIRNKVHIGITAIVFVIVLVLYTANNSDIITLLFKIAGYTYGPLLGLFFFAIATNSYSVRDKFVPIICIAAPFLTAIIQYYVEDPQSIFGGFKIGFLLIALNGLLTLLGLWLFSYKLPNNSETDD